MKTDIEVETWLRDRSSELFHRSATPTRISIARRGLIIDASIESESESRRVIVKQFPAASFNVSEFISTHEQLIVASPAIADFTPQFLACHGDGQWIAMQYIAGDTLEAHLFRALRGSQPSLAQCESHLSTAGRLLAEFHQVAATDIGLEGVHRENRTFLPAFQQWLDRFRWELRLMGVNRQRLMDLLRHLPEDLLSRSGNRVFLVDAQPKNILVDGNGRLHFIDLAYSVSNPAQGAALFLASIDRLRLWRPWARASVFTKLREAFLSGYLPRVSSEVRCDLALFYPWALLYTMHQHRNKRLVKGCIAGLFYARRLADCVATGAGA